MRYLRYLRKDVNLTTTEMSKRINALFDCSISREKIILFECNIRKPDLATAKIIAAFFNVKLEDVRKNEKVKF